MANDPINEAFGKADTEVRLHQALALLRQVPAQIEQLRNEAAYHESRSRDWRMLAENRVETIRRLRRVPVWLRRLFGAV